MSQQTAASNSSHHNMFWLSASVVVLRCAGATWQTLHTVACLSTVESDTALLLLLLLLVPAGVLLLLVCCWLQVVAGTVQGLQGLGRL